MTTYHKVALAIPGQTVMLRGMALLTFTVMLLAVSACTPLQVEEANINHPANPEAKAAPVEPLPDTLNVDAVEAPPELPTDPHAGHRM